jgi:hypothetical protein
MRLDGRDHLSVLLAIALVVLPAWGTAQTPSGTISGLVTTQTGTIPLPGALIAVENSAGIRVSSLTSQGDGRFATPDLPPGRYTISASLDGFLTTSSAVRVVPGQRVDVALDLPIGGFSESVRVEAASPIISTEGTLTPTESIGGREMEQFVPSGGLQSAMRLLANIIQVPGGVSIRGGRPSQASFQLESSWIVDAATGLLQLTLPDDAIDSLSVLPNPYAVEYGRFSSGLTVIHTRQGGDKWIERLNVTDPSFRYKRGATPFNIIGLGWYAPRFEVSGPVVKDRLFLEQAVQYRYQASEVGSLPQNLIRKSQSFSSFTRFDGKISTRHSFVASTALFPSTTKAATLGTFTPVEATVDVGSHMNQVAVTERSTWTDAIVTESTVQAHFSSVESTPRGSIPMVLLPQTTEGNFFNQHRRDTYSLQVAEVLSASASGPGGQHLFKVGFDALRNAYNGSSTSRPVLIERENGVLARRLDFSSTPITQSITSTDLAIFGQDRFQPHPRWYIEAGLRLDRDGVSDNFNLTPRAGSAVLLNASGTAVLRGGAGLFYERTPSTAGVFDRFSGYVDTRYATDGVTPLGPPVTYTYSAAPRLSTPRSRTWDLAYDHRLNSRWTFHLGVVDRKGSRELIVEPAQAGATGAVVLSSTGRSAYRGADIGMRFTDGQKADATVTYTRGSARADLNALTSYFDTILRPVIGTNAYAPSSADVPNRLLARGRYMPGPKWLLLGVFDWRDGLPYSTVNENLDFVGPRNTLRFPTYRWLLAGAEYHFTFLKFKPWIGVHVWNASGSSLPSDVQANIASSAFGTFYNPEYRQYRVQLRLDR